MNLYSHENGRYQSTNRDIVYGKQITLFPLDTNVRYTYFFFSVSSKKKNRAIRRRVHWTKECAPDANDAIRRECSVINSMPVEEQWKILSAIIRAARHARRRLSRRATNASTRNTRLHPMLLAEKCMSALMHWFVQPGYTAGEETCLYHLQSIIASKKMDSSISNSSIEIFIRRLGVISV